MVDCPSTWGCDGAGESRLGLWASARSRMCSASSSQRVPRVSCWVGSQTGQLSCAR